MMALRHTNVLQFFGLCTDPPAIVSEYCARGSLTDVLRAARERPADLPWRRRLELVGGREGWGGGRAHVRGRGRECGLPTAMDVSVHTLCRPCTAGHWRSARHAGPARRHSPHRAQVARRPALNQHRCNLEPQLTTVSCLPAPAPSRRRDLKSPNLLVDAHWVVKVSDFNLSRILGDAAHSLSSQAAMNPRWLVSAWTLGIVCTCVGVGVCVGGGGGQHCPF
jgi:hypothetical protein